MPYSDHEKQDPPILMEEIPHCEISICQLTGTNIPFPENMREKFLPVLIIYVNPEFYGQTCYNVPLTSCYAKGSQWWQNMFQHAISVLLPKPPPNF